jgi:nitronate monooxygenase
VEPVEPEPAPRTIPVVAAGGIADGRGLLAALALGASKAQLGTRFLLVRESGAHGAYRRLLLSAGETETVFTRVFTGRLARALRNGFTEEYTDAGPEPLVWPLQGVAAGDIYAASQAGDDGDYSPLFAGQALRMLGRADLPRKATSAFACSSKHLERPFEGRGPT